MTNFEKITASPEALGEFLATLPVATGPWDGAFRKEFCDSCMRKNCDEKRCPHQDKRNNPTWWLTRGGKPGEVPGLSINIKAAFPILWGKEYYTVAEKKKERRAPCTCCDNTGKVTIKGVEYKCPRCLGDWREKEIATVYSVAKWELKSILATSQGSITLRFEQLNSAERYGSSLEVWARDFHDMVSTVYGKHIHPKASSRPQERHAGRALRAGRRKSKAGRNSDTGKWTASWGSKAPKRRCWC